MWVPIALSRDVPKRTTRAVIVDGDELVVWRGDGGTAQVWEDRCPHRGMRLSFGFVRDNSLNCLYHGWEYGAGASCVRIPAHPDLAVPPTIKARAYTSTESGGLVLVDLSGSGASPPLFLAGLPIASLAVHSDIAPILALCAALPQADVQAFETSLDGVRLTIGWHAPAPGKVMLHVVALDPGNVESRALVALHRLRAQAEAGHETTPTPAPPLKGEGSDGAVVEPAGNGSAGNDLASPAPPSPLRGGTEAGGPASTTGGPT